MRIVAIHACQKLLEFDNENDRKQYSLALGTGSDDFDSLPRGVIVAVVLFSSAFEFTTSHCNIPFAKGPICFDIEDVINIQVDSTEFIRM